MKFSGQKHPCTGGTSRLLASVILLAGLSACGDAPLEPDRGVENPADTGMVAHLDTGGTAEFSCFTSQRTSDGPYAYRYGTIDLDIPRGLVQAARGETVGFRYRLWDQEGNLVRLANCVIPHSRGAVRWMTAWLRDVEAGNPIRWRTSSAGEVGTMDELAEEPPEPCPWDEEAGTYACEGVTVGPDPDEGGGDSGWPDDGTGGEDPCWDCTGGGGGSDPSDPDDKCDPDAVNPDPECEESYNFRSDSDWDGTGDAFNCRDHPGSAECTRIRDALNHLERHYNQQCRTFGSRAREIFDRNDMVHFTPPPDRSGLYGAYSAASGLENERIGLTSRAFNQGELAWTIAHEAAHAYGWPDRETYVEDGPNIRNSPGPDGRYADDWGEICQDTSN